MAKKCVVYARISVSSDASVSVERQVEAGHQYAAARGWQVLDTFVDDGVSASSNQPGAREGWRALLESKHRYDVVVILAIDRLSRRLPDWNTAHEALKDRGAGLVAVEQSFDTTTPSGRFMANLLAVFAEYEAEAIAARVAAARRTLLHSGRVVGGTVPYGWMTTKNPDGPGLVLVHDPERIGWVRGMVQRAQGGDSVYAVTQWLNQEGAPVEGWRALTSADRRKAPRQRKGGWSYSTVERLLRNPVLAGMTAYNPGNQTKARGTEVVRDENGLPVVDESVAVMPVADWRALVRSLDERTSAQSMPRASKASTSPLLSGLVWCADCQTRMWRARLAPGREGYTCRGCKQTITSFEDIVIREFLRQKGSHVRWTVVEEVYEGGAAVLPEIEQRLTELAAQLQATDDDDEADRINANMRALRALRREKREQSPQVSLKYDDAGFFGPEWEAAGDDVTARRAVLDDALDRIWVKRGGTGRQTEAKVLARMDFAWRSMG